MACVLCLWVSIAYQAVLCGIGLYGHLGCESVSVFDGLFFVFVSVDVNLFVNVFIYYNCMGV